MALESYDWTREYLKRHNIHPLFEECVEDLVLHRPGNKAEVTKCLIDKVSEKSKPSKGKRLFFAVGLQEADAHGKVSSFVSSSPSVSCVDAAQFSIPAGGSVARMQALAAAITATPSTIVLVTHFPSSIAQAVALEALLGKAESCLFFNFGKYPQEEAKVPGSSRAAEEVYSDFIQNVNPQVQYYRAHGRLVEIDAAAGDGSGALKSLLS